MIPLSYSINVMEQVSFNVLVDGQWGMWSALSVCSVTCGHGLQTRTRGCDSPAPANGGAQCRGITNETQNCNMGSCLSTSIGPPLGSVLLGYLQ